MREAVTSRYEQPSMARSALPVGLAPGSLAELPEDDPFTAYLLAAAGPVDIRRLNLESPTLKTLKEAGAVLVVPMISAGAPVGMLALGPRKSERDYTTDDRQLLDALARNAAPAIRVGQLVRQQQVDALRRAGI